MTLRYHKSHFIDGGRPRPRVGVVFPVRLLFAVVIGLGCRGGRDARARRPGARRPARHACGLRPCPRRGGRARAERSRALGSRAPRPAQPSVQTGLGFSHHRSIGAGSLLAPRESRGEKTIRAAVRGVPHRRLRYAPGPLSGWYVCRRAHHQRQQRRCRRRHHDRLAGGGLPPASTGVFAGRPALTRSSMSSWRASAWWSPRDPNSPR